VEGKKEKYWSILRFFRRWVDGEEGRVWPLFEEVLFERFFRFISTFSSK
jgi:hypothetical protein